MSLSGLNTPRDGTQIPFYKDVIITLFGKKLESILLWLLCTTTLRSMHEATTILLCITKLSKDVSDYIIIIFIIQQQQQQQ